MSDAGRDIEVLWLDITHMERRGFGFACGEERIFFHINETLRKTHPHIADAIDPRRTRGEVPSFVPRLRARIRRTDKGYEVERFFSVNETRRYLAAYKQTSDGYEITALPTSDQAERYKIDYSKWRPTSKANVGLVVCEVRPITLVVLGRRRPVVPAYVVLPTAEYSGEELDKFDNIRFWHSSAESPRIIREFVREKVFSVPVLALDIESDGERIYQIGVADNKGSRLLFKEDGTDIRVPLQELQILVKGKLIVGHNVREWDIPILERHGLSFAECEVWDTLQANLYLNPLQWTHALDGTHQAEQDAQRALNMFVNQVMACMLENDAVPSDLVPPTVHACMQELSNLKPLLSSRVEQPQPRDSEGTQYLQELAKQLETLVKTSPSVVVVPRSLLGTVRFIKGASIVSPKVSQSWEEGREIGVALCPDLLSQEAGDAQFYSLASKYLEAARTNGVSPDRYLIPPYLKHRLSMHDESWERTKKRCIDCSNEQCLFYPKQVRFTTYASLCEPSFWDYIQSQGISEIVVCYHPLIPPTIAAGVRTEQLDRLLQSAKGLLIAAREHRVPIDDQALSLLGFEGTQKQILENACWLEYTAYHGYRIVFDVRRLKLPALQGVSINSYTVELGAKEEEQAAQVTIVRARSPLTEDQEPTYIDLNMTTRYRADFWSNQAMLISGLRESLDNRVIFLVPQDELVKVASLLEAAGVSVVPSSVSLQRSLELLKPGRLMLVSYSSIHHLCAQIFELLAMHNLPKEVALVIPEVPLFPIAEQKSLDEAGLWAIAGGETESTGENAATSEENEEEDEQIDTAPTPRSVIGGYHLKEAAAYLSALSKFAKSSAGVQVVVTDSEVSPLGYSGLKGFEIESVDIYEDKEKFRRVYQKATALFVTSPLIGATIAEDVETRLQRWRNVLLPSGADYTPEQLRYLSRVMAKEDLVEVCIPTGGGKSAIFQIPAIDEGIRSGLLTVVISPLRALIDDQVYHLWSKGFVTCVDGITSDLTQMEINRIFRRVAGGEILLLYVTPERVYTRRFQRYIKRRIERDGGMAYWILDEAHCVSQWGLDFRPAYLRAARWISRCRHVRMDNGGKDGAVPVVFLSATMTAKTVLDLRRLFGSLSADQQEGKQDG